MDSPTNAHSASLAERTRPPASTSSSSPPASGTVMETETPRLAQLPAGDAQPHDAGVAAGLSQVQSPMLSQSVSVVAVPEIEMAPVLPTHLSEETGTPPLSAPRSPSHGGVSCVSNPLSLQSTFVTPALSVVHTPRGPQLPTFTSMPTTPRTGRGLSVRGEEAAEQLRDIAAAVGGVDREGEVIDVSSVAERRKRSHRDHFHGRVREDDMEFTSFALDASFVSAGSAAAAREYSTLYGAVFHIFKGNVGAGVFLLPTYYQDAGYIVGPICMTLLGLLMVDCTVSLLHVKHRINRVEVKTYPAVVEFVLGDLFQKFTQFALVFTQFGFCVMFLQYASSMFAALFTQKWVYTVSVAIATAAVTPMTFMSNKLHLLMYASMLAGVFVVIILAGTTVVDTQHIATQGVATGVVAAVPTARLIVFLSGHMFSLEGVGVVLPVENSLPPEKRVEFGRVLRYTLVSIVVLYLFFGVLGYVAYGEELHTSVVLALPPSVVKRILQVLLGLSLIFGFPIQYVPAIQIVDRAFNVNLNEDKKKAYLVRIALNVAFGVLAACIGGDTINIFASFLGAFAGVHLMITIPTLLALQLEHALSSDKDTYSYNEYLLLMFKGPYTFMRCRFYLYLLLAAVVWVGGLYYTVVSLFLT